MGLRELLCRDDLVGVGLTGGTSADGFDAALVRFAAGADRVVAPELLAWATVPLTDDDRASIAALGTGPAGGADPERLVATDIALARRFAEAAAAVRNGSGAPAPDFVACPGQTVAHFGPAGTLQLGCPATLAQLTGLPVVGRLRGSDVAQGGHGAPLAPFLDWVLRRDTPGAVLVNLGGIANLTRVTADPAGVVAFDSGPANSLLDRCAVWASDGARRCDEGGALAARGRVHAPLVDALLADPYFAAPPPKSTGVEQWGDARWGDLRCAWPELSPEDLMRSLVEVTARSVAGALRWLGGPVGRIELSGGGVHNPVLVGALREACAPHEVVPMAGAWVDAKEAALFALLGHETLRGRPSSLPGATGAARPAILGGVYQPS